MRCTSPAFPSETAEQFTERSDEKLENGGREEWSGSILYIFVRGL